MTTDKCPKCGTKTELAPGIGPFCPNKKCDRLDDLREDPKEREVVDDR
jgi:endogenous inhibitor of DNA gyrase (YacG/DUF329 family)